jgi:UDP-glucuronate 4-epimerase
MNILVTGCAGFIGAALCHALLERGDCVIGVDNINSYYDPQLKHDRLQPLLAHPHMAFHRLSIENYADLQPLFNNTTIDVVVNLAAQAGVRYSLENPQSYIDSNITGFMNILELCRQFSVGHLVYASSSSVYGANTKMPFSETDPVNHPVSLYAATKKSNELMAHTYSHLFNLPTTGLRFFTVYGPWGRPDMAPMLFAKKILSGETIDVFNYGNHRRDFTYIDDIVKGILAAIDSPATPDPSWDSKYPTPHSSSAPYKLYNIGSNNPVELLHFIELLEQAFEKPVEKNLLPMQPGDVPDTYADVSALMSELHYQPSTSIEQGVTTFAGWYKHYFKM